MTYQGWECLEEMPPGWRVDETTGSPLYGHVFVINGKSPLYGQKRALLKVYPMGPGKQKPERLSENMGLGLDNPDEL